MTSLPAVTPGGSRACGWSVVKLDHEEETLFWQHVVKRAELPLFLCFVRSELFVPPRAKSTKVFLMGVGEET